VSVPTPTAQPDLAESVTLGAYVFLGLGTVALSALLGWVDLVSRTKVLKPHLRNAPCASYLALLTIGNCVSTFGAMAAVPVGKFPGWPPVWWLLFGVFGFKTVVQRLNLTFGDKEVLTIEKWISSAFDAAHAWIIEVDANEKQARKLAVATRIRTSPQLRTLAATKLSQQQIQDLNNRAASENLDGDMLIALTIVEVDIRFAESIPSAPPGTPPVAAR